MRRRFLASAGALACALTGLTLAAQPASAADRLAPVMYVLDASGSMKDTLPAGGTRMDAAKQALASMVNGLPDGARVGLSTYGTQTGGSDAEKPRGCQDFTVLRPVGALDKKAMVDTANAIQPRGYTPIGLALRKAAAALPSKGPRSVVLVSDGIDTCSPPDPCEVARSLHEQGVDLHVDTVGFSVDDTAKAQLTCIAQATGGEYVDAPDAASLNRALSRVTERALRAYTVAGKPVRGGSDRKSAPWLLGGEFLDTIKPKETRYYAVYLPAHVTVYTTATLVFPPDNKGVPPASASLHGPDGAQCAKVSSDGSVVPSNAVQIVPHAVQWNTEKGGSCGKGGRYTLEVNRGERALSTSAPVPLELLVRYETPVTSNRGAPDTKTAPAADPAPNPAQVTGGGTFSEATTLGAGSYTDTLRSGEAAFYKVKLDWGQSLTYRVRTLAPDALALITTTAYSPVRQPLGGAGITSPVAKAGTVSLRGVAYANRDGGGGQYPAPSLSGWYYVQVGYALKAPGQPESIPVALDVTVGGQKVAGPKFEPLKLPLFVKLPKLPKLGEKPATPGRGDATQAAGQLEKKSDDSSMNWAWWSAGVLAVLGLGALFAFLMTRRRSGTPPPGPPNYPGYPTQ